MKKINIKRIGCAILVAAMVGAYTTAFAEGTDTYESYNVAIDGKTISVEAVANPDKPIMIPVRPVAELGGAVVKWDGVNKVVTLSKDGDEASVQHEKKILYNNLFRYDLDSAVMLCKGHTYVPVEVIERVLGCDAEVNAATKNISFSTIKKVDIYDDNKTISILPTEDTYVRCREKSDDNYGKEIYAGVCGDSEKYGMNQKGYVKYDISGISADGLKKVYFRSDGQKDPEYFWTGHRTVHMNLYEVEPDSWQEYKLTYKTQPEKGNFVTEHVTRMGAVSNGYTDATDITEYIKKKIDAGETEISFVFEGSDSNDQSVFIATREHTDFSRRPRMTFEYDEPDAIDLSGYQAAYYGNGVNPLENAKKMIAESNATYATENSGTKPVYNKIDSEYNEYIDGFLYADGKYETRATRTLASVEGYTPVKEEPKLSKYGGDLSRKYDEGTGFFRVEKIDGRWWFIDPEGYLMYNYAKCNVRPTDKEEYYKEMAQSGLTKQDWAEKERDYFKNDLKFNSLGGWSFLFRPLNEDGSFAGNLNLEAVEGENAMPFGSIRVYGVGILYAKTIDGVIPGGVEKFKGSVPPVFNPDFEEKSHKIIEEYVTPWKDNPYIMGWWSDNEIDESLIMLEKALTLDPQDPLYVYTYTTAWEWLKDRTGKDNPTMHDVTDKLRDDFREFVYDRYYKVMSEGFKKYAPNHLFFGNRHFEFAVDEPGIFRAAARYCDVISVNLYRKWVPDIVDEWAEYVDKPVQITEWYARPAEHANFKGFAGGFVCDTSEECGKFYQNFALRLLEARNVVGYHFFTAVLGEEQENYIREFNPNTYNLIDFFDKRNK